MVNWNMYFEIMIFFGCIVDLELLGNMIDFCFVGVLMFKLFCYIVCFWEL